MLRLLADTHDYTEKLLTYKKLILIHFSQVHTSTELRIMSNDFRWNLQKVMYKVFADSETFSL